LKKHHNANKIIGLKNVPEQGIAAPPGILMLFILQRECFPHIHSNSVKIANIRITFKSWGVNGRLQLSSILFFSRDFFRFNFLFFCHDTKEPT
jgi:hypothetical protein